MLHRINHSPKTAKTLRMTAKFGIRHSEFFRFSVFGLRSFLLALAVLINQLPSCPAAERPIPKPLPSHPGNIFVAGEEVMVPLPGNTAGWRLFSYENHPLVEVKIADGKAQLGKLTTGFYRLRQDGQTNATWISLGVVSPLKYPTPATSPVALDVAMAWFYARDKMDAAANLCALAGVNYVRDRLSWGEIEKARGQFTAATRYDDSARAQSAAGLRLLQVNHSSPSWANPDHKRFPLDLRDLYRFQKEIAQRWQGQVTAFEPWNEADIDVFGGHTGTEMAALQKAAYLGLKAGNPQVVACQNVFAIHRRAQLADLDANEAWPYFDTFNLHHYEPLERFPEVYADHRAVSAGRPLWVTECAMPVKWSGDERAKELSDENLREQAERVAKTFAGSLHEGAAATFYFMLPHYVEGQTQFGILRPDLTPRPAFLALAAMGRLLTDARPAGHLAHTNLQAFLFNARPDGQARPVLVAWAKNGRETVALGATPLAVYDHLGRPLPVARELPLDKAPRLVVLAGKPPGQWQAPPAAPARKSGQPSPVVFQTMFPQEKTVLAKSAYKISTERPETITLFAYNFSDHPVQGRLAITADPRFSAAFASSTNFNLRLEPMERKELSLAMDCRKTPMRPIETVRIRGDFGAAGKPVVSFNLMPDPLRLDAQTAQKLDGSGDPARWAKEIAAGGDLQIKAAEDGIEFQAKVSGNDRWVYPRLDLIAGERAPAGATGLAFNLLLLEGDGQFRVIWRETQGASYVSDLVNPPKPGKELDAIVTFEGAVFGTGWSPPDANNKLDPGQIEAFKIGVNTKDSTVRYRIRNLRWISF
jgi:hypothetical protein